MQSITDRIRDAIRRDKNGPTAQLLGDVIAEIERLQAGQFDLRNDHNKALWTLESRGYRRCSTAACNCNGWHGGNAELRLDEISDALGGCNGVTILDAVEALIAENAAMKGKR